MSKRRYWSQRYENQWRHDHLPLWVEIKQVERPVDGQTAYDVVLRQGETAADDSIILTWNDGKPYTSKKRARNDARQWMEHHPYPEQHIKELYSEPSPDESNAYFEAKRERGGLNEQNVDELADIARDILDYSNTGQPTRLHLGTVRDHRTDGNTPDRRGMTGQKESWDAVQYVLLERVLVKQYGTKVDSDPALGPRFEIDHVEFPNQ